MPRAAPRGREHRERKDEKRKVGRRSQERLDQAPDDEQERDRKRSAETKKWGKCIFLLLGAAAFQALVGLSLLQSHSEALNRSDLLVNSGGVAGPLAVFADPEAPFVVEVKDEGLACVIFSPRVASCKERVVDPGDLAVLVLSTARKVWLLRATLQSLSRVDGLRAANVLVSLASPGTENQLDAIQEFGFACAGFEGKGGNIKKYFPIFQQAAQGSPHVRRSLEFARKHFAGKEMTSLLVLEEGQIFSLELLWFFVQLLPVLRHDESIFCASAWNENGLAPYVADLTVLHRSDNFSSIAWMLELRRVQPLLAAWKQENDWRNWLQQHMVDAKQQCIFPEVSRVGLASADCLRPSSGPSANAAAAAAHVAKLRQLNVPVTAAPSTKCTEEEVQSQRVSLRSVTSGQLRGFLGDVLRMQAQSYEEWFLWRWPGRQGMFYSQAVRSVTELDVQLGYEPAFLEDAERPRQVLVRAPLRLVLTSAPGSAWAEVAKYFGFPSDRPRATYQGVIRFWWRNVVLYLVLDPSSPLLESTERYQSTWVRSAFGGGAAARSPQLSPAQFKDHLKDLQRPPHRAIPPGAAISAAPLGESCLRHCEAQGQLCVDADLTAVAACAPPVTLSFGCKICEEEAVTSAFPGLHRDTGRCAAGQPAPGASDAGIMAGDCSAAAPRVRRFCVCRLPLVQSSSVGGKTHLRLKSPGLHFAHEAKTSHADVASAESLEAFKASTVKARPNTYAKLNLFSAGLLPAGDPRLGPIRSIFVLVLQPTVQSVASLRNLTGLVPSNVLLVSDGPLKVDSDFRTFTRGRTTAGWKGEALKKGSVMAKEVKATSLLLLEGGQALSPDLLVLLGQLEPLLHSESSLWCVSAWNDHGLAPYVADSTNVLRTDWFSGVAWMTTLDTLAAEILPKWKEDGWAEHLRGSFGQRKKQCLIPEVSRALPVEGETSNDLLQRMPLCTSQGVDLGNVERLQEVNYLKLFLYDWPMDEGLFNSKPLSTLRPLADGRTNSDGPFSIIFRCHDIEKDITWKALAAFFGLWPQVPIRGTYEGVLRLRWRDSILYLIATSSPLLQGQAIGKVSQSDLMALRARLKVNLPVDPMLFYGLSTPFLRPPGGEVRAALWSGADCHSTCTSFGQICVDQDLFFINHCAALGSVFSCRACAAGETALVVAPAQMEAGDALGICLLAAAIPNTQGPSCGARHPETRRLCACRSVSVGLQSRVDVDGMPASVEDVNLGNVSIRKDGLEAADELQLDSREELPSRLDAPILVLASAGRHEMLERCLRSLAALPGYRREQVLVSQDGADSRAQWVAEELFKVAWVLHDQESLLDFDARVTEHYREAISYTLYKRFPSARSLLVVEEDMEAANDLLWYFAQLEPLLQEDPTLWCISAWNENCPAPFAADLTGLSRSDVFSGTLAWMLPAELYRKELLLRWPSRDWAQHFRSPVMAAGRECLVPEVSRVRHLGRDTRKDTAKAPEAAALQDARMLVSGPLVDFATAKQHVLPEVYREEMRKAVQAASPIKDLRHLPARLSGKRTESWQVLKGYRLVVQSVDRSGWEMVANFFKLSPAYPPTGLYHNLLRLRWGAGAVFFLVLGRSDLLEASGAGEVPAIPAEAFRLAVPPVFVAAENVVAATKQDMGRSCTSLCEAIGKVCYSADLLYLNSCTLLRQFHSCSRCEASHGADQPAFWSPQRGNRASGGCLYNSDILLHPPSCDAAHPETQRLCACRYPLMAAPMVPGTAGLAPAARANSAKAAQNLALTAEAAGWKPGPRAEAWQSRLMAFAPSQDAVAIAATVPLVLLLAVGDRAHAVRETLMSLKSLRNFDERNLVVSLGCCGAEAEKTKRMIEVDFPELLAKLKEVPSSGSALRGRSRLLANSARDTEQMAHGIAAALKDGNASSLLVVHEGTVLSPDALPFFAQLEPLMTQDPTIWCIGAWNHAGLAPYVADLTALFRTDWHPAGHAWMMRAETLQELLRQWPGSEWERFIQQDQVRLGRHCIIPEVSRCRLSGPPSTIDDPALRRSERTTFDEFHQTVLWNKDVSMVHLGDVRRMQEESYEKLVLSDWPQDEALVKSSRATPRELAEATSGNHYLVLEDRSGSWSKVMSFFRLPSTKEIRLPSSYKGYLRLRWRGGVVHLLQWNSPLLALAEIPKQMPKRGQDFPLPPVLRAPDVSVLVGHIGDSCDRTCSSISTRCHDEDLLFLNGCAAIRRVLGQDACGECLGSDGQEFPAVVLLDAETSAAQSAQFEMNFKGKFSFEEHSPSLGSCLYSVNLAKAPRCNALHQRLARLCPCRPSVNTAEVKTNSPSQVPSTRAILRDLIPLGQQDVSLPSQRCGAMFGNGLAGDCVAAGFWCCSAGMWCGNSPLHCKSPDHECRGGASPFTFCGAGWTLRLPALQLPNLAG